MAAFYGFSVMPSESRTEHAGQLRSVPFNRRAHEHNDSGHQYQLFE